MLERRLRAEWDLLLALVERNPGRLLRPEAHDTVFRIMLQGPAARLVSALPGAEPALSHSLRIVYPVHFPAVPMEMYLSSPVRHPNVHPRTGFVCLWNRHRVSHTVEHALHKAAAMLAGRLWNEAPLHVMQAEALLRMAELYPRAAEPDYGALLGIEHPADWFGSPNAREVGAGRRNRLT